MSLAPDLSCVENSLGVSGSLAEADALGVCNAASSVGAVADADAGAPVVTPPVFDLLCIKSSWIVCNKSLKSSRPLMSASHSS